MQDTIRIRLSRDIWQQVKSAAMAADHEGGAIYVHARSVHALLEGKPYELDGCTHRGYILRSKRDGGTYGRGKTPIEAVAWACQMFPLIRTEVLGG